MSEPVRDSRRRTGMRHLLLVLLLTLAAGACGPPAAVGGEGEQSDPPAAGIFDGEWRLTSGTGPAGKIPVPEQVTLEIAGQKVSGVAACNGYRGTGRIADGNFAIRDIMSTAVGCPGQRAVAEERYLEALQAATEIERKRDTLRVTGASVSLLFEFVPLPEPAAFEDTKWKLTTLILSTGPAGTVTSTEAPASITFHGDGSLTGTTGCVDLTGQWQREGDTVTVADLPRVDVDCRRGGQQNDHLMEILRAPFTVELRVRQLDLQQVDGELGAGYSAD